MSQRVEQKFRKTKWAITLLRLHRNKDMHTSTHLNFVTDNVSSHLLPKLSLRTLPMCTTTDRDMDYTTTCYQPCYRRLLYHQPWITVTNHGSDTNTCTNTVSRSSPTCPCMPADDCHLKPDFIITLQYSATRITATAC